MAEHSPDVLHILDRDYRIVFANQPSNNVHEVLGKPIEERIYPEYRDRLSDEIDFVFETGERTSYVDDAATSTEEVRWFSTRIGPITHEG